MQPCEPHFRQRLRAQSPPDDQGWCSCAGLDLGESEQLLDWLEAAGFTQREVVQDEEDKVTVRWRA